MIEAKVEIKCPCCAKATLIADPMFVVENTTDDFYVECCQCGRRYYLIVKEKSND